MNLDLHYYLGAEHRENQTKNPRGDGIVSGAYMPAFGRKHFSQETGLSPDDILSETRRPPLRPLKLDIL